MRRAANEWQRTAAIARPVAPGAGRARSPEDIAATPGRTLDAPTRAAMEARLGHDFGAVRNHDSAEAAADAALAGGGPVPDATRPASVPAQAVAAVLVAAGIPETLIDAKPGESGGGKP